jgi:DUF4097 and DUF4098 domain-containing protein YvlB
MPATFLLAAAALSGVATPDTVVRLRSGASIEIHSAMCGIMVRVGTEERLSVTGGSIEVDGGTAEVNCAWGQSSVMNITVPPSSRLEVSSVSGSVTLNGVTERLEVNTMNGAIRLTNGGGRTTLETVAGTVTVTNYRGVSLAVDAVAGVVTMEDVEVTGRLSAESINAGVRLRGVRAQSVSASSVNASVDFAGSLRPDGNYAFESHNGSITLTLPGSTSARLRVSSVMGDFETEIQGTLVSGPRQAPTATPEPPRPGRGRTTPPAPPVPPRLDESDFTIVYGKGEARVTVDSFNGPIRVKVAK